MSPSASRCVNFIVNFAVNDGTPARRERRLLTGTAARAKYQTLTVGYRFDEMCSAVSGSNEEEEEEDAGDGKLPERARGRESGGREDWERYDAFVDRIYSSTPGVRAWLTDVLASSLLADNRQIIVFHYNSRGSNGKSTMFELIRRALGGLHEACQSNMLSDAKRSSSGN